MSVRASDLTTNSHVTGLSMQSQQITSNEQTGHYDVQAYSIRTAEELSIIETHLKNELSRQSPIELQAFDISAGDDHKSDLHQAAVQSVQNILSSSETPNKNKFHRFKLQSLLNKNLDITLSLVRFITNATTITAALVIGKDIPISHGIIIGMVAGGLSGYAQYKTNAIAKWLSQSKLLIEASRKIGLSKNQSEVLNKSEKNLQEVEKFIRWGSIDMAFLAAINSVMMMLNIPVTGNLFETVIKSTASQGMMDIGVFNLSHYLKAQFPERENKINKMTSVGLFISSGISVMSAASALVGVTMTDLGFITLSTTGLVLRLYPTYSEWKRNKTVLKSCLGLFQ